MSKVYLYRLIIPVGFAIFNGESGVWLRNRVHAQVRRQAGFKNVRTFLTNAVEEARWKTRRLQFFT